MFDPVSRKDQGALAGGSMFHAPEPKPALTPDAAPVGGTFGAGTAPRSDAAAAVLGHWAEAGGHPGAAAVGEPPPPTTYVVKAGDNLSAIAKKLGTTQDAIAKANGIKDPSKIAVGQKLTIPVGSAQQGGTHKPAETTPAKGGKQQAADEKYNGTELATVSEAVLKVVPKDMHDYAVSNIPLILQQSALRGVKDAHQVAYILATAQHESSFGKPKYSRSESLVEDHNPYKQGKNGWSATEHAGDHIGSTVTGKTEAALETNYWDTAYGGKLGNKAGTEDGANFKGRGFVQLTGRNNYASMSKNLNDQGYSYTYNGVTYGGKGNPPIDLTAHPDHVNKVPEIAARILVTGMKDGDFTGKSMDNYINSKSTDYVHARAVVNGDTAANGQSIANIATTFQGALGDWSKVFVLDAKTAPAATPK